MSHRGYLGFQYIVKSKRLQKNIKNFLNFWGIIQTLQIKSLLIYCRGKNLLQKLYSFKKEILSEKEKVDYILRFIVYFFLFS